MPFLAPNQWYQNNEGKQVSVLHSECSYEASDIITEKVLRKQQQLVNSPQ